MWLSLVERSVRDAEAEGSNPFIPTIFVPLVYSMEHCTPPTNKKRKPFQAENLAR